MSTCEVFMSYPQAGYNSTLYDVVSMGGKALRVAAHYGLDRLLSKPSSSASSIPWNFRAVTREWFQDVLCSDVPGARVESFRLGVGHLGTTGRQQYLLEYNREGEQAGLPKSIFAKGTPDITTRISMSAVPTLGTESIFYGRVRPFLDIEAPIGYYSNFDCRSGRSIHLIEDLVETKNATFPKVTTLLTRDNAEEVVHVLAKLHGSYYEDPRLAGELKDVLTWPETYRRMCRAMNLRKYNDLGISKAEPVVPPNVWARRGELWPCVVRSTEVHDSLPQTITHADVHLGNWYITGAGRMGLLDWQCLSRGHWSRDLAYAIAATLSVEQRREWEEALVAMYSSLMKDYTGADFSFDDVWLRYRQQMFGPLAFWTATYSPPAFAPDNMQPPELGLEMVKRFTTAIDDLRSLDSFD